MIQFSGLASELRTNDAVQRQFLTV
jgi:hypothetical protein